MGQVIEERTPVGRSPDVWWGLLVEPRSWTSWWPAVREARSLDFKPLREGSVFDASLDATGVRVTLRGTVELCADGRALAWRARWLGVPLRHEWFAESAGQIGRLLSRTTFQGGGATLLRLLHRDRRWREMLVEQVRGLKRVAERL